MGLARSEMSATLCIATTSLKSKMADKKANLLKCRKIIAEAVAKGAEIVVFPETFLTGYTCGEVEGKFFELAEPIPGPSTEILLKLAKEFNVYIAIGFVEANHSYPGLIHNSASFLGPEGIIHVHRKVHCPNFPPFKEISYGFTPGNSFKIFKIKQSWRIGMLICYDASFPEPARILATSGADLLITMSAAPIGTEEGWNLINKMRARENTVFNIFSNLEGPQWGNITFCGGAAVVGPEGEYRDKIPYGKEDMIVAKLEARALFDRRKVYPVLRDRQPQAYGGIASIPPQC